MNYLTPEQVLFIHYRLLEETGGRQGIRDLALLQSALARLMATFDNNDLYPDLFSKAAVFIRIASCPGAKYPEINQWENLR